ncbi:heavy metal-associated domain-containing protein [Winogradskyella maritima]|uniref:Cation transporter n=1 Tax=Winogradskyella maritima TaxID=1517766 RepID=A0ABV8AI55_9FLAO|nr:heavy metal-associated domain-containing protein [Winogradskyella maritima]
MHKVIALAICITGFTSCKNNQEAEIKTIDTDVSSKEIAVADDANVEYAKVQFNIEGMTCAMGCAKTIEKKMAKLEGVKSAKVDFDSELAMVEYDASKVSPERLEETVTSVGGGDVYEVKNISTVGSFEAHTKPCKEDCKMACCKDKKEGEKMACEKDCKKACCKMKA